MTDVRIIWDVTEEPDGPVQHIAAYGITVEEVEEVLLDHDSEDTTSRFSGRPSTSPLVHVDGGSEWLCPCTTPW